MKDNQGPYTVRERMKSRKRNESVIRIYERKKMKEGKWIDCG